MELELIASHHFMCRGIIDMGVPILKQEEAVAIVVNVYKNGNVKAFCTYCKDLKCSATLNEKDYAKCIFIHNI